MPTLIRGDRLAPSTRAQVLEAFGYRWTVENEKRAREWTRQLGGAPERTPTETDAVWLRAHAFYANKNGSLAARRHAEPWDLDEGAPCACCGWHVRRQDGAHQVAGTNTLRCDMCSSGHGACCHRAGRGAGTPSL